MINHKMGTWELGIGNWDWDWDWEYCYCPSHAPSATQRFAKNIILERRRRLGDAISGLMLMSDEA